MVKNPYIILQARMNSERLPGKVMKPVGGKPLIGVLINRILNPEIPVLLATSVNPENDELVDFAMKSGIEVFRGSENNVLERYFQAAKSVNADLVFRLTGDNPFIDAGLIQDVLNCYVSHESPRTYVSTGIGETFPLGISVEAFSFALLEEAFHQATLPGEFEHVTPYMYQNKGGNIKIVEFSSKLNRHHYRLTVDTPEDFELIRRLIEDFGCASMPIDQIIPILDHHPELAEINREVAQKTWCS